jgi:FAD/FMN-containing dehydrogenase
MTLPTIKEYELMLRQFDWYYAMSDDYSVWKRGSEQMSRLQAIKAQLDPHGTIWDQVKKELKIC